MSRFLVVTWDGAGNLVSTLAIAEHLAERGHDVRLLGHRSIPDRAGSGAWRFRPFVHTVEFDSATPFDLDREMTVMARDLWFSETVASDVQDELAREPADVVVADCMLMGRARGRCRPRACRRSRSSIRRSRGSGRPMVEMLRAETVMDERVSCPHGAAAVDSIAAGTTSARCLVVTAREVRDDMALPAQRAVHRTTTRRPPLRRPQTVSPSTTSGTLVVVRFSTSYQQQSTC